MGRSLRTLGSDREKAEKEFRQAVLTSHIKIIRNKSWTNEASAESEMIAEFKIPTSTRWLQ